MAIDWEGILGVEGMDMVDAYDDLVWEADAQLERWSEDDFEDQPYVDDSYKNQTDDDDYRKELLDERTQDVDQSDSTAIDPFDYEDYIPFN